MIFEVVSGLIIQYGSTMEEAVLTIIGSMMAAIIVLIFASMRMHHRDNLATRDEIARTNLETREHTAGQIEKSHDDLKRMVQDNHKESQAQFGEVRSSWPTYASG